MATAGFALSAVLVLAAASCDAAPPRLSKAIAPPKPETTVKSAMAPKPESEPQIVAPRIPLPDPNRPPASRPTRKKQPVRTASHGGGVAQNSRAYRYDNQPGLIGRGRVDGDDCGEACRYRAWFRDYNAWYQAYGRRTAEYPPAPRARMCRPPSPAIATRRAPRFGPARPAPAMSVTGSILGTAMMAGTARKTATEPDEWIQTGGFCAASSRRAAAHSQVICRPSTTRTNSCRSICPPHLTQMRSQAIGSSVCCFCSSLRFASSARTLAVIASGPDFARKALQFLRLQHHTSQILSRRMHDIVHALGAFLPLLVVILQVAARKCLYARRAPEPRHADHTRRLGHTVFRQ